MKKTFNINTVTLMLVDALILAAMGGIALLVRFDLHFSEIPSGYLKNLYLFLPIEFVALWAVFAWQKLYAQLWTAIDFATLLKTLLVSVIVLCATAALSCVLGLEQSKSVTIISLILKVCALAFVRCVGRLAAVLQDMTMNIRPADKRIMLIGAGDAGRVILHDIRTSSKVHGRVCCIIDDDESKWGRYLEGVKIVGGRESIVEYAKQYFIDEILIAIPSAPKSEIREIVNICKYTDCKLRHVPGVYQVINGEIQLTMRDVDAEDLLGRESVKLDTGALRGMIEGKTILVTGGGGSIGSELCRQIAHYAPKRLIVLDYYENNAYEIQQELNRSYGTKLDLVVKIASVRDKVRVYEIFEQYRPDVVFHAAAHKHVPLMESDPEEAVKNNIFGTYHVVRAAEKFEVSRFVMISTDKAVNPTNFMGATKRFCEMILQSRPEGKTVFCAVRFGNVLGSNGSVVPLFKKQIAAGGPLTITDKRIIRFFMTIPEAAQLVLEAGAMAKPRQIFVLDMGEPVKILTLAENLIRFSGLEPYKDIEITEIGLRPGEKLYEELLMSSEALTQTSNEKIFIEAQRPIDSDEIMGYLKELDSMTQTANTPQDYIEAMRKMVLTYHDPEEVNFAAFCEAEAK